ncbi:glycosyl hydrolase [Aspergillus crustosus]
MNEIPWAPDVFQRDDGRYVLYYSTIPREDTRRHCIGGAIDADGFRDDDGILYITYKVDGSAINTEGNDNYHPTPLVLQEVEADGYTRVGEPITLLDRNESDGRLIEAPSITKVDGIYYLFYSSHMFNSPDYDSKFATAPSVAGPYTQWGRVIAPGDPSDVGPLSGPGGADVSVDGAKLLFHANLDNESCWWEGAVCDSCQFAGWRSHHPRWRERLW